MQPELLWFVLPSQSFFMDIMDIAVALDNSKGAAHSPSNAPALQ
jgi:hypothetical protein